MDILKCVSYMSPPYTKDSVSSLKKCTAKYNAMSKSDLMAEFKEDVDALSDDELNMYASSLNVLLSSDEESAASIGKFLGQSPFTLDALVSVMNKKLDDDDKVQRFDPYKVQASLCSNIKAKSFIETPAGIVIVVTVAVLVLALIVMLFMRK